LKPFLPSFAAFLLAAALLPAPIREGDLLVPGNMYSRTFCLRIGSEVAAGFVVEVGGGQYLITARHFIDGVPKPRVPPATFVEVFRENGFVRLPFRRLGVEPASVDIAVLAIDGTSARTDKVALGWKHVYLGEPVFFLGYVLGYSMEGVSINNGFPIALVKHGILASLGPVFPAGRGKPFLVDALNTYGFSGGPVIRIEPDHTARVLGVVSGFVGVRDPVYLNQGGETELTVGANTGLMLAYSLDYALEAISKDSESKPPLAAPSR
jgi:hypothetical protein